MIKKIVITALLSANFSLAADLYTDIYMSQSGIVKRHIETGIPNTFSGEKLMAKKTVVHTSVYFKQGVITEYSRQKLQELLSHIKPAYYVSVIGHVSGFTEETHTIALSPWAEFWQNIRSTKMSKMTLAETVNYRIKAVCDYLEQHDVATGKIYNENRMDRDPISTEATSEGKALNNRVDVTLYY